MSAGKKRFTSATAPRGGGKKGRKVKLSGQALAILDKFLADFARNGPTAIKTLRIENVAAYVRLGLETSAKVALAGSEIDDGGGPSLLVVRWATPDPIPSTPEPPTRGPMQMPRLLSFERPLD